MKCPSCQAANPDGQRFCGACGHAMERACARCSTPNPPNYKFCGQCGADLGAPGAITLARSGLITQVNEQALTLLGWQRDAVQGKAFSLFVKREDLVVFFSHWNELLSQGTAQSFEIALNHKEQTSVAVRVDGTLEGRPPKDIRAIHLTLTEVGAERAAAVRMQTQEELLGVMESVTDSLSTVDKAHLEVAVKAALKKICLFTHADLGCIHGINRALNCLETLYAWRQPWAGGQDAAGTRQTPLPQIKHTIMRLGQEKTLVVDDPAQLASPQRDEWPALHPETPVGGAVLHLIYSGARPVGVLGLARRSAKEPWAPDAAALVKCLGALIAERLPAVEAPPDRSSREIGPGGAVADRVEHPLPEGKLKSAPAERAPKPLNPSAASIPRPMALEKYSGQPSQDRQSVIPRDDGLVLLTCPGCGLRETASVERLDKLGKTVGVGCACGAHFIAVLEKRRFLRKPVRLEGYFSVGGDYGPIGADGSIWGTMVVKDLSKAGLRFTTTKTNLLHPGDLLMVRFNLDNANQALIHKPARVVSVTGQGVGCLFVGADRYDITLGFYLM